MTDLYWPTYEELAEHGTHNQLDPFDDCPLCWLVRDAYTDEQWMALQYSIEHVREEVRCGQG